MVNVRRQNLDSHLAATVNVLGYLSGIINDRGHKSSHILYWIIIFEPCCLVRNDRICCRMGFVKRILGEICHFIINLIGSLLVDAICNAARYTFLRISVHKILTFLCHNIGFLLGHGTSHKVTSSKSISRQITHDLHNLLLIDNTAISR